MSPARRGAKGAGALATGPRGLDAAVRARAAGPADGRRHRADRHLRLRPDPAAAGRRPHRADHRHRPPAVRPGRARLDEDGVPAGRRPRRRGAARGVRRRRRRRPPGVPHHRQRVARDHPGDQRRRHAQRVPRGGRGRRRSGSSTRRRSRPTASTPTTPSCIDRGLADPARRSGCSTRRRRPSSRSCCGRGGGQHPELALYLLRPPVVLGPNAVGREGRAARPAGPARAGGCSAGRGGCRSRCRCWRRSTRCSSSTRTTSAARCCSAWSPPVRPAPTTSPVTASLTAVDVAREFGALADAGARRAGAGRGAGGGPAAVPAAGRRMGRGGQPAGRSWTPPGRAQQLGLAAPSTAGSRRCAPPCAPRRRGRLVEQGAEPGRGRTLCSSMPGGEHVLGQPARAPGAGARGRPRPARGSASDGCRRAMSRAAATGTRRSRSPCTSSTGTPDRGHGLAVAARVDQQLAAASGRRSRNALSMPSTSSRSSSRRDRPVDHLGRDRVGVDAAQLQHLDARGRAPSCWCGACAGTARPGTGRVDGEHQRDQRVERAARARGRRGRAAPGRSPRRAAPRPPGSRSSRPSSCRPGSPARRPPRRGTAAARRRWPGRDALRSPGSLRPKPGRSIA